jgi:hypothetical protein
VLTAGAASTDGIRVGARAVDRVIAEHGPRVATLAEAERSAAISELFARGVTAVAGDNRPTSPTGRTLKGGKAPGLSVRASSTCALASLAERSSCRKRTGRSDSSYWSTAQRPYTWRPDRTGPTASPARSRRRLAQRPSRRRPRTAKCLSYRPNPICCVLSRRALWWQSPTRRAKNRSATSQDLIKAEAVVTLRHGRVRPRRSASYGANLAGTSPVA